METYNIIQKNIGETPLQAVERFRERENISADTPLAYAGRLDPMASGALLVLIGEECKKVAEYNNLDKTYQFEILLGFESDTGDVLGLANACDVPNSITDAQIEEAVQSFAGMWHMEYPKYSSKPVDGKPLFRHMYDGTISNIEIPTKEVEIYHIAYKGKRTISADELHTAIEEKIHALQLDPNRTIPGNDFRKDEILTHWYELFQRNSFIQSRALNKGGGFYVLECEVRVSAGTYIRALAPTIAERLGTCGLAFSIHRTEIDV